MNYQEIADLLEDKKLDLLKRVTAIEADFRKGRSQDFSEQTTETENDQVLDEIHHEAKQEIVQINAALSRIATHQYGSCVHCAQLINPARLLALPYTNSCIDCAKEHQS